MILTITGFDEEDIIAFQEKVNTLKETEMLTVFIKSSGGSTLWKDIYLEMFKRIKNIEIIWVNISSSAFDLFAEIKCKRSLVKSVIWMVHHSSWEITFWKEWPKDEFAKFQVEYQRKQKGYDWLNRKERKIYEKGLEVWLDYDRLIEIFPNAKHE